MLFEFKVNNKEITQIKKQYIINTDNYNKCKFYFDEQTWGNKEIFVTFTDKSGYTQISILGRWDKVLSCSIPDKIVNSESFKIFAHTQDMFKTNTIKVNIKTPGCKVNKKHTNAIEYLNDKINTKINNISYEDNQLKCYSDNTLIDTIYIDNIDEALVRNEIQAYLQQMPTKIDNVILSQNNIIFYGDEHIVKTISLFDTSLSEVAWSGNYNDLQNIPNQFNPSPHTHNTVDITDYEESVDMDLNTLLDFLSDEINKE